MTPVPARAVILAAGTGSRLQPLTTTQPKCLVDVLGRPILSRQLEVMRALGLTDITVVAGHAADRIDTPGVRKIVNPAFASSNMVASLFCAERIMAADADLVMAYGDIVYQRSVLTALLQARAAVAVCVDRNWHAYWAARMPDPLADVETLKIGPTGTIVELGKKTTTLGEIQGQYIGLVKFRADTLEPLKRIYHGLPRDAQYEGKSFPNMFMTTFVQILIDAGWDVRPVFIEGGWLEVDTRADLEAYETLATAGTLTTFYDDRR